MYYFLDNEQLELLKRIETFLYSPKTKTGDQIRDNANLINHVLSEVKKQTLEEYRSINQNGRERIEPTRAEG